MKNCKPQFFKEKKKEKKYLIKSVRMGIGGSLFIPVVVAGIKVKENDKEYWLFAEEVESYITFFKADKSIYSLLKNFTISKSEEREKYIIYDIEGLELEQEHEKVVQSIIDNKDNPVCSALSVLVGLLQGQVDVEELKDKYTSDINIDYTSCL